MGRGLNRRLGAAALGAAAAAIAASASPADAAGQLRLHSSSPSSSSRTVAVAANEQRIRQGGDAQILDDERREAICAAMCSDSFGAYCAARSLSAGRCAVLRRGLCGSCSGISSTSTAGITASAATDHRQLQQPTVELLPASVIIEEELLPEDASEVAVAVALPDDNQGLLLEEVPIGTDEPTVDTSEPTMERVPTTPAPNAQPLDIRDEFEFVPDLDVPTAVPTVAPAGSMDEGGDESMDGGDMPTSSASALRLPRFGSILATITAWMFGGGRRSGIGGMILLLFSAILIPSVRVSAQDGCIRQGTSQCSSFIPQLNCCTGLSCQPFIGCYPNPREIGNPCLLTYGQSCTGDKCCGDGLVCRDATFSFGLANVGECQCASGNDKDCRGSAGGYNVVIIPAPTPAEEKKEETAPVNPPPTPIPTAKPITPPPTPPPTAKPTGVATLCDQIICFDPDSYCESKSIGLADCGALVYDVCECFPRPTNAPTSAPVTANPTPSPSGAPQTASPTTRIFTFAPVAPAKTPTMVPTAMPVATTLEEEKGEIGAEATDAPTAGPVEPYPMPCEEEAQSLLDCMEANDCTMSSECDGDFARCDALLPFYCCQISSCMQCEAEAAAEAMCISDEIRALSGSTSCGPLFAEDCVVREEVDAESPDATEVPTAADTEAPSKGATPEPTFFPTADEETSSASAISSTGTAFAILASTIAIAAYFT
mmetsp:Transcript_3375/g.7746  ORF Transcript_3375/g.7746 Transcript_3375/m.7746 type:complete len:713 (-) Transcript_3375:25-2163(-)